MFNIKKLLTPTETIVAKSCLHWILIVKGLTWFVLALLIALYIPSIFWNHQIPDFAEGFNFLVFYGLHFREADIYIQLVLAAMVVVIFTGLCLCIYYMVKYLTSIILITENRFIYKTGLIFIHIEEIEIDEIEEVHINTGILGRFFNYAYIHVDMRFVGEKMIGNVARPYQLVNYLHRSHDKSEERLAGITDR